MQQIETFKTSVLGTLARALSREGWLLKLWPLWSLWLVCMAWVMYEAPIKVLPSVFGVGKVLMGGLCGLVVHWAFRQIHPMPVDPSGITVGTDWKCAAWIIAACIVALAFVP